MVYSLATYMYTFSKLQTFLIMPKVLSLPIVFLFFSIFSKMTYFVSTQTNIKTISSLKKFKSF